MTLPGRGVRSGRSVPPPRLVVGVGFGLLGVLDKDGTDWCALALGVLALPALVLLTQLFRLTRATTTLRATGPFVFCANLFVFGALLLLPWTSDPTFVFLGASMLVAAGRGYAGCETLAISNWLLRRNDQVGCTLFTPIDALERRLRSGTRSGGLPLVLVGKLAACLGLTALLVYTFFR